MKTASPDPRDTGHRSALARKGWAAALAIAMVGVVSSCASGRAPLRQPTGIIVSNNSLLADLSFVRTLAVLDFYEGHPPGTPGKTHICHLTGFGFNPGDIGHGAGGVIANLFRHYFIQQGLTVRPIELVNFAADEVEPGVRAAYGVPLGLAVGDRLGVDAVVMGVVMRFEELKGTKWGAEKAASVAFSIAVIGTRDRRIIWSGKFEKTQQALFTNVLDYKTFFKGGMVWQKAERLAAIGVTGVIARMPLAQYQIPKEKP